MIANKQYKKVADQTSLYYDARSNNHQDYKYVPLEAETEFYVQFT